MYVTTRSVVTYEQDGETKTTEFADVVEAQRFLKRYTVPESVRGTLLHPPVGTYYGTKVCRYSDAHEGAIAGTETGYAILYRSDVHGMSWIVDQDSCGVVSTVHAWTIDQAHNHYDLAYRAWVARFGYQTTGECVAPTYILNERSPIT